MRGDRKERESPDRQSNRKRVPMKWIPFADSVVVFPSQGEELLFLGGGFLVGFEEGLLWCACEHL